MIWIYVIISIQGCFQLIEATATLTLRLDFYTIPQGKTADRKCCDTGTFICTNRCDPFFEVCMDDDIDAKEDFSECSIAEYQTGFIEDENDAVMNEMTTIGSAGTPNPKSFSLPTWPGVIWVKVKMRDDDGNSSDEIDHFVTEVNRTVNIKESEKEETTIMLANHAQVSATLWVYCDANYYGPRCDVLCTPGPSYDCTEDGSKQCHAGWAGENCATEIDECASSPCANRGKCTDKLAAFECSCFDGWRGDMCEENIDECSSSPCQSSGTCNDQLNGFNCTCSASKTGTLCELSICTTDPCVGGGTCLEAADGYSCQCPTLRTGPNCETEINPCESNPCNNGSCITAGSAFKCTCTPGYTGETCSEDFDECLSSPCKNGATCIDHLRSFKCQCAFGYSGEICAEEIDECASNPCSNGATCKDLLDSFNCACSPGFAGETCNEEFDECISGPCQNGATCQDMFNSYNCTCLPTHTGDQCELSICTTDPCEGGGTCLEVADGYSCQCPTLRTGPNCETEINPCESNPCNNGSCITAGDSFKCTCLPGFSGNQCELSICTTDPCEGGGTCLEATDGYSCQCPILRTGPNCETEINPCESNPCNNGSCITVGDSFKCTCPPGFEGETCSDDFSKCLSSPCKNGATCQDQLGSFNCTCLPSYLGDQCELSICTTDPCEGGGTCLEAADGYSCQCPTLRTGPNCETEINPCESNPCNNGSCITAGSTFHCTCLPGFSGETCTESFDECSSSPCQNNATCQAQAGSFNCTCLPAFRGMFCELSICTEDPCGFGGTCQVIPSGFKCNCPPYRTGLKCEVQLEDMAITTGVPASACSSDPCQNGASCIPRDGDDYRCQCASGYRGKNCQMPLFVCSSDPCHNGGTCRASMSSFVCDCEPGFQGILCQELLPEPTTEHIDNATIAITGYIEPTTESYDLQPKLSEKRSNETTEVSMESELNATSPTTTSLTDAEVPVCVGGCGENGWCDSNENRTFCNCQANYTGSQCETNLKDPCESGPCLNHGNCSVVSDHFKCTCPSVFTGSLCEVDIDECQDTEAKPCLYGGACSNLLGGFECVCFPEFTGSRCQDLKEHKSTNEILKNHWIDSTIVYIKGSVSSHDVKNLLMEIRMILDKKDVREERLIYHKLYLSQCKGQQGDLISVFVFKVTENGKPIARSEIERVKSRIPSVVDRVGLTEVPSEECRGPVQGASTDNREGGLSWWHGYTWLLIAVAGAGLLIVLIIIGLIIRERRHYEWGPYVPAVIYTTVPKEAHQKKMADETCFVNVPRRERNSQNMGPPPRYFRMSSSFN